MTKNHWPMDVRLEILKARADVVAMAPAETITGVIYTSSRQAVAQVRGRLYGFDVVYPDEAQALGTGEGYALTEIELRVGELMQFFEATNWEAIASRSSWRSAVAGLKVRMTPVADNIEMVRVAARCDRTENVAETDVRRLDPDELMAALMDAILLVDADIRNAMRNNPYSRKSVAEPVRWATNALPAVKRPVSHKRKVLQVSIGDGEPAPRRRKVVPV